MKKNIIFYLIPFLGFFSGWLVSCTDTLVKDQHSDIAVDDSNLVEVRLSLDVETMCVPTVPTRTDDSGDDSLSEITEDEKIGTEAERRINNIWVFQFDAETKELLIAPQYYEILNNKNGEEVEVLLKPDVSSVVYVVVNVGKTNETGSAWSTAENSATLDAVMKRSLPSPDYIAVNTEEEPSDLSLPMEGASETVTLSHDDEVTVKVTRMYSKVEILVGDIPESIILTDVNVTNIPYYCQVGTLAPDDSSNPASYPDNNMEWHSYAFKAGSKDSNGQYSNKLTIYVPENLQGCTDASADLKSENAPSNALKVDFVANYVDIFTGENKESGRHYTVYPGSNIYNDYNICRNYIYRVKLNIYTDKYDQDIPSSNCFVVKPNQSLSFLPYYRTETGGGYDFADYLNPEGDDDKKINDSENMLENIKIIWQSENAIGDNTNGDKVWVDRRSDASDEMHRKIHVKTGECGNALIAAYNKNGEIIWSWHIWITDNEPANISNAIVYSTYAWNENGINNQIRVPGYAVMPCNLGALRNEPSDDESDWLDLNTKGPYIDGKTFGMLYQWGRKDPFPPVITSGAYELPKTGTDEYTDDFTGYHYDNGGSTVVGKTNNFDTDELFHSHKNSDSDTKNAIKYTIEHPTVFMTYGNNWLQTNDSRLWGAEERTGKKSLTFTLKTYVNGSDETPNTTTVTLCDDYGDNKSIFDPCPSGWRVPPMDMWLNFTSTGLNPQYNKEINCKTDNNIKNACLQSSSTGKCPGLYLYVQAWQSGPTLFFPTQGRRMADGRSYRCGGCGNYNCATENPTNSGSYYAFHIHNSYHYFRVIETSSYFCVKSLGSAVRCVRDHK